MSEATELSVDLAYDSTGEGFPLVLVHGFTGSSLDWSDVVEPLANARQVVTFDHRGHGESPNTGDAPSYTFDQLVADMTVLLDDLELERFDLLGHSMGGIVSMRYAIARPERVRSLVLMDTAAGASADNADVMRAGIEMVRTRGTSALFELIQGFLGEGETADAQRARMKTKLGQMDPVAFAELGEELLTYPSILEQLAGLGIPTTVLVGANDHGLRAAADDLAATIPDAELVVIPDAAHSPQEENRHAWLAAVEQHFARVG
ncbi:MAG: alpha/beta fold hydrolase [Acidimicrobiia bacterium]